MPHSLLILSVKMLPHIEIRNVLDVISDFLLHSVSRPHGNVVYLHLHIFFSPMNSLSSMSIPEVPP